MFATEVTYSAALLAGLISFFSPCVLPLVPAYFTFITGYSLDELTGDTVNARIKTRVLLSTLAFVGGFSFVFILLGASASLLGGLIAKYQGGIRIAGGVIIIVLGIHMTGLLRIKILELDKRMHIKDQPVHFFGTFIVGMAFGGGWSPCIGPLLGSILIIAGSEDTIGKGIVLLSIYSAGLAFPFLVISVFINFMLAFLKKASKAMRYINATAGVFLIVMGILLLTDKLSLLSIIQGS